MDSLFARYAMTGLDAETRREVEQFVSEWVRENDVPGTSVAVVDEDGLAYAEGLRAKVPLLEFALSAIRLIACRLIASFLCLPA